MGDSAFMVIRKGQTTNEDIIKIVKGISLPSLHTNLRCDACLQGLAYTIFEGGTPIPNIVCISV